LKIISPAPRRQADCEGDIIGALMLIELYRKINSRRSPAELRKLFQKLAKTLNGAVDLANQLGPFDWWNLHRSDAIPRIGDSPWRKQIIGDLENCLREVEAAVDYVDKNVAMKGAPRHNDVRAKAAERAHMLLTEYSKEPGLSREGPWHRLARVLFDDEQADLFDYMKDYVPLADDDDS
jgi:hypothetical protein